MRSPPRRAGPSVAAILCALLAVTAAGSTGAVAASVPAALSFDSPTSTTTLPGTTTTSSTTSTTSTTSPTSPTTTTLTPAPVASTTTSLSTTTTTLDPVALANLIQGLGSDVAEAQAVSDYLAARAAASTLGNGLALSGTADPVLVEAAAAQLRAANAQAAAQERFRQAERGIAQVALDLYVSDQPPDAGAAIIDTSADRSAFLDSILQGEEQQAKQAKQQLVQADAEASESRQQADQLVQARTAQLQAIAVQSADNAARAASTAGGGGAPGGATVPPASLLTQESPSILGPSVLTGDELVGWYQSSGRQPNLTVPIAQLATDFESVGAAAGVRADLAFAQSVLETDYFGFPSFGQVAVTDNNFAGIGACDSCSTGLHFPDALTGVEAQMQLLHGYATTSQPFPGPVPGPITVTGCCVTWMALSGVWATNPNYGVEILTLYRSMVQWALRRRTAAARL